MPNQFNGMPNRQFINNSSMTHRVGQQMHHMGYMSQNHIPKQRQSFGLNSQSKAFKPKYMNRWNSAAVDETDNRSRFGESQTKSVEGRWLVLTLF